MSPTLTALLRNAEYRAYFLRQPVLPKKLHHPAPWKVWALKDNGKWAGKAIATFPEAFDLTKKLIRKPGIKDAAICSRVVGFKAPEQLVTAYRTDGYDWCIMCRRPTIFKPMAKHHALRQDLHVFFQHHPVCFYCGMREETMVSGGITLGRN